MNNIDQIMTLDELIPLFEKKVTLLKELRESLLFETADYICDKIGVWTHNDNFYVLVERITEKIVCEGSLLQINKYLDRKGITSVYWRNRVSNKIKS